ncbi:MAG: hypothetical protein WA230_09595, partial [Xanthobacteraceae bacterium]
TIHMGQSLLKCAIRNMSVRHPNADMRADIAGGRFGADFVGKIADESGPDRVSGISRPDAG